MNVYAVDISDPANNPIAKFANIGAILNIIIPLMTLGAGLVFLAMLIVGSFNYLTSGGSPENIKKAQGTLFSAVLGLIIVICAYLIVKTIDTIFNIGIPI